MNDAERVVAIERRHELTLLDQLLDEKRRPVPPPPRRPRPDIDNDPALRRALITVMQLLATTYPPETRGGRHQAVDSAQVVDIRSTRRSSRYAAPSTRTPHAIGGSL